MEGIKTFPIIMSKEFHKRLKDAAYKTDKHIKDFAMESLERSIKEIERKEQK